MRAQIERYVFHNPGDWSTEHLFEQLRAFDASDTRFARFLEGLVSPHAIPDEPAQRRIVDAVNPHLQAVGAELGETGADGGYPVFSLVSTQSARTRRPKNLIFATLAKPDIRFRDAFRRFQVTARAVGCLAPGARRVACERMRPGAVDRLARRTE